MNQHWSIITYLLLKLCISTIRVTNDEPALIHHYLPDHSLLVDRHVVVHILWVLTGALGCTLCGCWQVCNKVCPPSQGHTEQFHCPGHPVPHPTPLSYTRTPQSAVLFCFVTYHFLLQNLGSVVYLFSTSHSTFSGYYIIAVTAWEPYILIYFYFNSLGF